MVCFCFFRYGAEAYIAKPNFHSRTIFSTDPDLVGIQLNKTEVVLNKPMYVGFAVLDISKTCLYRFHYDIMPKLVAEDKFSLLYTDTDSLIYSINTDDIYQRIKANLRYFDTSDFPEPNPYGMPRVNKKIVGLMKDECSGEPMTEFVGLRSKMYSVRVNGEDKLKKCKGVKYGVVQRTIQFDDYKRCLDENSVASREQRTIISRAHRVFTIQQSKLALSPFDDKRYLIPESKADTLPWGHYQSSDPENVMDLVDIDGQSINVPVVNNARIVNNEVPLVNNDDDDDADLQEALRVLESLVEDNRRERAEDARRKRKREEEEEFDMDVLNAIVDVCSMPMDYE